MKELKRVILKLSGEALSGEAKSGYDDALIEDIARQVKKIVEKGIDVGVVDRKSTRLNSSHANESRMPSSA